MSKGSLFPIIPHSIGDCEVSYVTHHQVRGEGVLGDEQDGTVYLDVKRESCLAVWSSVDLQKYQAMLTVPTSYQYVSYMCIYLNYSIIYSK